jgi:hypothetical protein
MGKGFWDEVVGSEEDTYGGGEDEGDYEDAEAEERKRKRKTRMKMKTRTKTKTISILRDKSPSITKMLRCIIASHPYKSRTKTETVIPQHRPMNPVGGLY